MTYFDQDFFKMALGFTALILLGIATWLVASHYSQQPTTALVTTPAPLTNH